MLGGRERVRAPREGGEKPRGTAPRGGASPAPRHIHDKLAAGSACDINEFNGGAYVVQKHNGRDDFIALPVFLHRRFPPGFIYINKARGIAPPADLIGPRGAFRPPRAAGGYLMR